MTTPSASSGPHGLVTAAADASSADWIADQLMDWWSLPDGFMPVGAVIPKNFPAYVRILHPAQRAWSSGQVSVRWSDVAGYQGLKIGPETLWEEIAPSKDDAIVTAVPSEGSLPLEDARTLANILRLQTRRPDACFFAVWEGYAALEPNKRWPGAPRLHLPNQAMCCCMGRWKASVSPLSRLRFASRRISGGQRTALGSWLLKWTIAGRMWGDLRPALRQS
jgi:hypothetical protein